MSARQFRDTPEGEAVMAKKQKKDTPKNETSLEKLKNLLKNFPGCIGLVIPEGITPKKKD